MEMEGKWKSAQTFGNDTMIMAMNMDKLLRMDAIRLGNEVTQLEAEGIRLKQRSWRWRTSN